MSAFISPRLNQLSPVTRALLLRLRRAVPRDLLGRTRCFFFVLAMFATAIEVLRFDLRSDVTSVRHLLVFTVGIWMLFGISVMYIRRHQSIATDLFNAIALFSFGCLVADGAKVSQLAFPVMFFLSLYGSTTRATLRSSLWIAAFVCQSVVTDQLGQLGFAAPVMIVVPLVGIVMTKAFVRIEQSTKCQRVLTRLGLELVGLADSNDIDVVVLDAAYALMEGVAGVGVTILATDDRRILRSALTIGEHASWMQGISISATKVSSTEPSFHSGPTQDGEMVLLPLTVRGSIVRAVGLVGTKRLPAELISAAESLAVQTTLALERIRSDERFRSMVELSSDTFVVIDSNRRIRYQSPAALQLHGLELEAMYGSSIDDLVHVDDVAVFETALGQSPTETSRVMLRWKHADGSFRGAETSVRVLPRRSDIKGWLLNIRDISDRLQLEVELRQAQKLEAVGRMAAGIAHEINTPVQFVGDNIRFFETSFVALTGLLDQYRTALSNSDELSIGVLASALREAEVLADIDYIYEETGDALRQGLDGVERIAGIVQAVKSFGYQDGRGQHPEDLNEALTSTLIMATNEIKYVADVVTDFGDIPLVHCIKGDINQVFLNLLVNAGHAIADVASTSAERGTITIATRQEDHDVVISITDTGSGIPSQVRDKIFEPFFTTKLDGRGSGQGLAISRAIVERHAGAIDFETRLGKGTTFFVRLPITGARPVVVSTHEDLSPARL